MRSAFKRSGCDSRCLKASGSAEHVAVRVAAVAVPLANRKCIGVVGPVISSGPHSFV